MRQLIVNGFTCFVHQTGTGTISHTKYVNQLSLPLDLDEKKLCRSDEKITLLAHMYQK